MSDSESSEVEKIFYPIGYIKNKESVPVKDVRVNEEAVDKRSWATALEPIQGALPNAFMLWMSGSKISLFPIILIVMNMYRHLNSLCSVSTVYKNLGGNIRAIKILVFILGQLIGVLMILYKCLSIGLLTFDKTEWMTYNYDPKQVVQMSFGKTGKIT